MSAAGNWAIVWLFSSFSFFIWWIMIALPFHFGFGHDLADWHPSAKYLWHMFVIFFARHWLLAIANAGVTALLGLWLVRLLPKSQMVRTDRWAFLFQDLDLRLLRFLYAAALCKGAFYLVLGDSHQMIHHHGLGYGLQIPNPREVLNLIPQERNSTIWRPTVDTERLAIFLGIVAFIILLLRVSQVLRLLSWLNSQARAETPIADIPMKARLDSSLIRAAATLGLQNVPNLPIPLLGDRVAGTPFLIGFSQPYILIAPALVNDLTNAELDAIMRHELVHFQRHDHRWRWLLTWAEDIGRINPVSAWLSRLAMEQEETLCDRWASRSAYQAAALGRALLKAWNRRIASQGRLSRVIPQMLGHARAGRKSMIAQRLKNLIQHAEGFRNLPNVQTPPKLNGILPTIWTLLVAALVLLVIYCKFFFVINVAP